MNQTFLFYEHTNMKLFLLSQRPFILKQTWVSLTLALMMYETKLMYTNQEIIKIDIVSNWWGEKSKQTVRYKEGFTVRPVPPRGPFSPASQSFSHSGNDNRSINTCILERQVLQYPPGETAHEQAGTLTCATSFQNFHSSALEVVTPQRAEIQYLKASTDAFTSFLFYL